MIIALFITAAALAIVCAALYVRAVRQDKEIDSLYERIETLVEDIDAIGSGLNKHLKRSDQEDQDMEARIAARIEKKWDDGLQSMLDFDPLSVLTGGDKE